MTDKKQEKKHLDRIGRYTSRRLFKAGASTEETILGIICMTDQTTPKTTLLSTAAMPGLTGWQGWRDPLFKRHELELTITFNKLLDAGVISYERGKPVTLNEEPK